MGPTRPGRGPGSGRTVALVGAAVAVGAAVLMTAGVAAAAPGRCLEDVDVRAEPGTGAEVVAGCGAGTAVATGRVDGGFVEVDGRPPGGPASTPAPSTGPTPDPARDPVDGRTDPADDGGPATTTGPHDAPPPAADDRPAPAPAPAPDPLGGLL